MNNIIADLSHKCNRCKF